jgi:hypothetical protein
MSDKTEGDFFKERFYQKRWRNRFRIGLYSKNELTVSVLALGV